MVKVELRDRSDRVETLWATPVGRDRYKLDNSPFYAYGVSWQDVIEARPEREGDIPTLVRVVRKSGGHGRRQRGWFPCRNELMPRKPATIIQKTAPGPPTPTCIWRRQGVAPGPGSSFGGGIPPPLDLVVEFLCRYVPLSAAWCRRARRFSHRFQRPISSTFSVLPRLMTTRRRKIKPVRFPHPRGVSARPRDRSSPRGHAPEGGE